MFRDIWCERAGLLNEGREPEIRCNVGLTGKAIVVVKVEYWECPLDLR